MLNSAKRNPWWRRQGLIEDPALELWWCRSLSSVEGDGVNISICAENLLFFISWTMHTKADYLYPAAHLQRAKSAHKGALVWHRTSWAHISEDAPNPVQPPPLRPNCCMPWQKHGGRFISDPDPKPRSSGRGARGGDGGARGGGRGRTKPCNLAAFLAVGGVS